MMTFIAASEKWQGGHNWWNDKNSKNVTAYFNNISNVAPGTEWARRRQSSSSRKILTFNQRRLSNREHKSSRVSSVTSDMPGQYLTLITPNYYHVFYNSETLRVEKE